MAALISRSSVLFLLLLYAIMFNRSMSSNHKMVRCNAKDRGALLTFKRGVIDPSNTLSTWSSEKDCCAWEGVLCDNTNSRVTELDLSKSTLTGEINLSLLELEFLIHLDLKSNEFETITFPPIGDNVTIATSLQYLDLSNNQLRGSIPDLLGQQKNLQYLDLSYNHFNGSIPEWISQKEHLQHLDLTNNLFYGSISSTLRKLSFLEFLRIGSNSFSGTISETVLSKFSNLKILDLSNSTFEFNFNPEWIPPFQLSALFLANTNQGPNLPSWIYTQKSLEYLDITSSGISSVDGDKFRSLIAGGYYRELCMSNNSIDVDLSNLMLNSSLLMLDHNNFTGGLPHLSPMAEFVDLSYNSFSGSIPRHWEKFTNLSYINLWSNRLSGEIQLDLSNMTYCDVINLGKNEFSGTIPINLPQNLRVMILRSNQFEGNIPPQIFNLSSLFHLDLAHNNLSGSMPRSVYNITEMIIDYVSGTYYGGEVIDLFTKGQDYEYFLYNFPMRTIDLSVNNLSGEIPLGLFGLIKVQTLNLSYNQFTGTIQKAIGGMKNLESLDLSNNKLYGEIPQSMATLSFLGYLNLSCNNLTGQIPTGTQLQSFNASSYIGNPKLCGAPIKKCGTGEEDLKNVKQDAGYEDGDIERKSLYLGMGVGFAVGFWGICGSFILNKKWRHTYYKFLDRVADQLYVTLMVKFNKFGKS